MDEHLLLTTRDRAFTTPRLDRDPALIRLRAGAYVPKAAWASSPPWERYLLRVLAVAATWTSPVFCLESAAVLQGLPVFGEPRDIHLLSGGRCVAGKGCRRPRLHRLLDDGQRGWPPGHHRRRHGGRPGSGASARAVADAVARRLGSANELRVADVGRSQPNHRGVRKLDWVQARTRAEAESPGESVSRAVIEWLGFEQPELQVVFSFEGTEDRVDFFWPTVRAVGESDGYGKCGGADVEQAKRHFVREKKREDRLRRHLDGFARWDWSDATRGAPLRAILEVAGVPKVRHPDRAMLATLTSNPRSLGPSDRAEGSASRSRT